MCERVCLCLADPTLIDSGSIGPNRELIPKPLNLHVERLSGTCVWGLFLQSLNLYV